MERGLDAVLPTWDWHEVHGRTVDAPPERALAALVDGPIATGAVRLLFRARGLRPTGTLLDGLDRIDLKVLSRGPGEVVVGGCGRPWRLRGAMGAFADPRPGTVLIACGLRAEPIADGRSFLSTETRIKAVDGAARRRFRRYWPVVRPWSAVIRRAWLRSAADRV